MTDPLLNNLGVWGVIVPLVFVLAGRSIALFKKGRKGGATFTLVLMLYLERIAILRFGTEGGSRSFTSPENTWITGVLGNNIVFFIFNVFLAAAWVYQVAESEKGWAARLILKYRRQQRLARRNHTERRRVDKNV